MRENTKIVMLIVALAFVGLMVFEWGMDISGQSSPGIVGEVGRVNGRPISYQEWSRTYRSLTDQARQEKGTQLTDREIDVLEDRAWNQLVNQILIEEELSRRGIRVTDEEVRQAFRTMPPPWVMENELFQTDGEFDYDKYREFFAGPGIDPRLLAEIEDYYRRVLPRSRLLEQVASGIYVSDSELWQVYRDRNEAVAVEYLVLDPETMVPDTAVTVTEAELRQYYRDHRDEFEQPPRATVGLVALSRLPDAADTAATRERARELRERIVSGDADFAELAREHSADRASAEAGGALGWLERGDVAAAFEEAAFGLRPGQVSEPVLTQFGFHIIKVTERDQDRVRASHILIPIALRGASEDRLLGRVDRLEGIALTQGLETAADSLGLRVQRVTLRKGSDFVPGIGEFGPAQHWAFHDSTFVGDLSPVYETAEGFYVLELEGREPAGTVPFEEAQPGIRSRVLLEKKLQLARETAEEVRRELQNGVPLEELARRHGLELRATEPFHRSDFVPGLGQANAVIGAAFGLDLHEVAGPVDVDDRLYFLKAIQREEASREAFDGIRENMRAQLARQRRDAALDNWLADLRDRADIVDQRAEFFQPRT